MPAAAAVPPALAGRVFRGRDAVARGSLTPRQLQACVWRRLLRGVYADAVLAVNHGLFISAANLVIPPEAAIAGRSAAWLWGADDIVAAQDPVEILVPWAHRFGPVAGLRIRTVGEVPADDVDRNGRVRVTRPGRTATDVAGAAADLIEAVVAVDRMLASGAVRPAQLARAADGLGAGRGTRQTRRAAELADGRSESPQESRLRVRLVLAGLPAPVPQYEVRHDGRFVARVDMAYPEHKLAIEYDGLWHGAPGQLGRDRRRLNAVVAAGWRVVHVTAADLHKVDRIVAAVRVALAA